MGQNICVHTTNSILQLVQILLNNACLVHISYLIIKIIIDPIMVNRKQFEIIVLPIQKGQNILFPRLIITNLDATFNTIAILEVKTFDFVTISLVLGHIILFGIRIREIVMLSRYNFAIKMCQIVSKVRIRIIGMMGMQMVITNRHNYSLFFKYIVSCLWANQVKLTINPS